MKRYILCAALLFSYGFSFSSEPSGKSKRRVKMVVTPLAAQNFAGRPGAANNTLSDDDCSLITVGCLAVAATIFCLLPTREATIYHMARNVDCTKLVSEHPFVEQKLHDIVCTSDMTPCHPHNGKDAKLPCNFTLAQQERIWQSFQEAKQEEQRLREAMFRSSASTLSCRWLVSILTVLGFLP